jgi:hypothetical protein
MGEVYSCSSQRSSLICGAHKNISLHIDWIFVGFFFFFCKRLGWYFRSSASDLRIEYKSVLITGIWSEERFSFFPYLLGSVYPFARWYQGWILQQTQDDTESKWPMCIAAFIYWIKAVWTLNFYGLPVSCGVALCNLVDRSLFWRNILFLSSR